MKNRLKIVGGNNGEPVLLSTQINDLQIRWSVLEDRLIELNKLQDEELSKDRIDKSKIEQFNSVISKAEQEQAALLAELTQLPATNPHDAAAKLQIWARINCPEDNEWASPTDHLVMSVLNDLVRNLDGA